MNELLVGKLEQVDITNWDFEQLKGELQKILSDYKGLVYTDDSIKTAKDDKARLAKAKKAIEDKRKAYKEKCLAPYNAIEPQIKEIVGMIEDQRLVIDDVVKDYTGRQKAEKEKIVRNYYDKKSSVLGDLYEKLLNSNSKWLNASASKKKVEEEIQTAINNVSDDIAAIKAMKSPFEKTLIETYISTLSVDEVRSKHEELMDATAKAGMSQQADSILTRQAAEAEEQAVVSNEEGVILKVYAGQNQLNQVLDFMKAIGVKYELQ